MYVRKLCREIEQAPVVTFNYDLAKLRMTTVCPIEVRI